jgi:hypothetical protein
VWVYVFLNPLRPSPCDINKGKICFPNLCRYSPKMFCIASMLRPDNEKRMLVSAQKSAFWDE